MKLRLGLIGLWLVVAMTSAQAMSEDERIEDKRTLLAIRMIGDEVMKGIGDYHSRVLPVHGDGNKFTLSFDKEFAIHPDIVIAAAEKVIQETKISKSLLVEIVQCESGETVHIFEAGAKLSDNMTPCKGRDLPLDCYNILVTVFEPLINGRSNEQLLNSEPLIQDIEQLKDKGSGTLLSIFVPSNIFIPSILFVLVLGLGLMIFYSRRTQINKSHLADSDVIKLGESQFDRKNMAISYKNRKVELSNKESELLALLHHSANQAIEREIILQKVWGDDGDYVGRTLDVFISKLRKKLEDDDTVKIVNIRGVGYKLILNAR